MKKQWRTRTRGSRRQIGKKFQLGSSQQKLKAQLPRISGKVVQHIPRSKPKRIVELKMIYVNPFAVKFGEKHPVDLDRRAKWFMKQYREGKTIPPILVHREKDGSLVIYDGHARVEAYRRLRVKKIPAVENLDLFKKKDRSELYSAEKKFIPPVISWKARDVYDKLGKAGIPEKPSRPSVTFAKEVVAKPLKVIPVEPKLEAQKKWKPRGYQFTEEIKARRKGAILRKYKKVTGVPIEIGRKIGEVSQALSKPLKPLQKIREDLAKGRPMRIEVIHRGTPQEQLAYVPVQRERALEREVEEPKVKQKDLGLFTGGSPLLAARPKVKKKRKRKKAKRKHKGIWYET